jgi:hypothetical protein
VDTPSLSFNSDSIGDILNHRWLEVPLYQRPYAWEKEHVAEFWDDLKAARVDGRQYFLGAIVLTRGDDRFHVIDGQQRLATATLLLTAIRDELAERDEDDLARHVESQYLAQFNPQTRTIQPKLQLAAADSDFYMSRFVRRSGGEPVSSPQRRLTTAFDFLRGAVAEEDLDADGLMAWVDLLTKSVLVVVVEAETEADAFQIFETLNDRGAPLTLADLLKNYLMSLQPTEYEALSSAWDQASENLGAESESQDLVTFIRHYWSSNVGATRERDLYRSLRSSITSGQEATELAYSLVGASENYAAILDATHPLWSDFEIAPKAIETLLYLQLGQYRPLLLAALDHFEIEEVEKLSEALVCWSVRGLIAGGIGGGTTERAYASAGVSIRQKKVTSAHGVFTQLRPIIPADDEFRSRFETASLPRVRIGLYVLRALDRQERGRTHPALEGASDDPTIGLSLSHVLPRSFYPNEWPGFAPDDVAGLVSRIGNLTLAPRLRRASQHGSWEDRRAWLAKLDIPVNNSVASFETWSLDGIRRRQQEMAVWALRAWPRSGGTEA